MLGTREKLKACQGQYETMELLRAIESRYMQEGFLVREASVLKHSERDVEIKKKSKTPSLPAADPGGACDGAGRGEGASHAGETLEENPRGARRQAGAADARREAHHDLGAAQSPRPAAEPHHRGGGPPGRRTAEEGRQKEQEEEREENPTHSGDSESLPSSDRAPAPAPPSTSTLFPAPAQAPASASTHRTTSSPSSHGGDARTSAGIRSRFTSSSSSAAPSPALRPPSCQRISPPEIHTKPQQHRAGHVPVASPPLVQVGMKHQHQVGPWPSAPPSMSPPQVTFFPSLMFGCYKRPFYL